MKTRKYWMSAPDINRVECFNTHSAAMQMMKSMLEVGAFRVFIITKCGDNTENVQMFGQNYLKRHKR